MFPWEHLAFGYLLYALVRRGRRAGPPSGGPVLVLALATQLPDLIDKPLAWWLLVLPSGHSLAHSLLFALPLAALVAAVAVPRGHPAVAVAWTVGYLSHLAGDVVHPALYGYPVFPGFLVWPYGSWPLHISGLEAVFADMAGKWGTFYATPAGKRYLAIEAVALLFVAVIWIRDGKPGVRVLGRLLPGHHRGSSDRDGSPRRGD